MDRIKAHYLIETSLAPESAAKSIAGEQSSGTFGASFVPLVVGTPGLGRYCAWDGRKTVFDRHTTAADKSEAFGVTEFVLPVPEGYTEKNGAKMIFSNGRR